MKVEIKSVLITVIGENQTNLKSYTNASKKRHACNFCLFMLLEVAMLLNVKLDMQANYVQLAKLTLKMASLYAVMGISVLNADLFIFRLLLL